MRRLKAIRAGYSSLIIDHGRVTKSVALVHSGLLTVVWLRVDRANPRPIALANGLYRRGDKSKCKSTLRRWAYHLEKRSKSGDARARVFIDFTPRRSRKSAIATGGYGHPALVMGNSNSLSKLSLRQKMSTFPMWPRAAASLIKSRSRTRSVIVR